MPDSIGNLYLTDSSWINPGLKLVGQGYGTLLMVTAVACWYGRKAGPSLSHRAMLLFLILANLALIVIHSLAILTNVETPAAGVSFLIGVGIAIWSGMLVRQENRIAR